MKLALVRSLSAAGDVQHIGSARLEGQMGMCRAQEGEPEARSAGGMCGRRGRIARQVGCSVGLELCRDLATCRGSRSLCCAAHLAGRTAGPPPPTPAGRAQPPRRAARSRSGRW